MIPRRMMKKVLLLAVSALTLFCSCERLFESPKDKLDRLVSAHWDAWKAEGKDTTMCIVDIAKIVPIEWDTMVYVRYSQAKDSEIITDYINNRYWVENEQYRGYPEEGIHFWKDLSNGKMEKLYTKSHYGMMVMMETVHVSMPGRIL